MQKNKNYDYRFWGEVAIFVVMLYGISSCVYLNGDDFMYAAFSKTGIFQNITNYYFTGNGRYWINILDSVLLWFDRYAFIILLPWIVMAFIVLLAKNVQRIMTGHSDWSREKNLIRMGMVLFTCLDVMCLRETVFWITGMMNYLFPSVLFLLGYWLFQKSRAGELSGLPMLGYYLVCVLTASSVEQYALMYVGMMTLHHGCDLFKKVRIPICEWIAYGLSLAGLVALILAPGNFVRVDDQNLATLPFMDNAWTLLYQCTLSDIALPYLVMLTMSVVICCHKGEKYLLTAILIGELSLLSGWTIVSFLDKAIIYVAFLFAVGCFILGKIICAKVKFREHLYFLLFVGIGSQVMLLISAVWGYRCMLSLYMVYMLVIGCLLYHASPAQRNLVLLVGIVTAIHPLAAVIVCIAVGVSKSLPGKHPARNHLSPVICVTAFISLAVLLVGYAENVPTHRENLQNTVVQENNTVVINELPDDTYSWYFVPIGEFHEEYYRILHDIPEEIELVYETMPE